jgi:hypothetical protein
MTLWGVDRRVIVASLVVGALVYNVGRSFLLGMLGGGVVYGVAWLLTAYDPQIFAIVRAGLRQRRRYDPATYEGTR